MLRKQALRAENDSSDLLNQVVFFISYSRKDKGFALDLREALQKEGYPTWLDVEGIPLGVKWRDEILSKIRESEIFLFIISPDSIRSLECQQEMAQAVELGKRIIPIVYHPVSHDSLPEHISSLQWIPWSDQEPSVCLESLFQAAQENPEWLRIHTRLSGRASEWYGRKRSPAFLIRGLELKEAEAWQERADPTKKPQLTPLLLEYIAASRRAELQRLRSLARRKNLDESRRLAAQATRELEKGYPVRALLRAVEAGRKAGTLEASEALRRVLQRPLPKASFFHPGAVLDVDWSPDGRNLVTACSDGVVRVWDAASGSLIASLRVHEGGALRAVFSPDGKKVATGGRDRKARIWDAQTGRELVTLEVREGIVTTVAFDPSGRRVLTVSLDDALRGRALVWDAASGELLIVFRRTSPGSHLQACFSCEGRSVVTIAEDEVTCVWRVEPLPDKGTLVLEKKWSRERSHRSFSRDGSRVVSVSFPGLVRIWDIRTGKEVEVSTEPLKEVSQAYLSQDGKKVFLAGENGSGVIRNLFTLGEALFVENPGFPKGAFSDSRILSSPSELRDVVFSPDARTVVGKMQDGTFRAWDSDKREELLTLQPHGQQLMDVHPSPEGSRWVTIGRDGWAHVLDLRRSGEHAIFFARRQSQPTDILRKGYLFATFSDDGTRVLIARNRKTIHVFDALTAAEVCTFGIQHFEEVSGLAVFSPDSRTIAITSGLDEGKIQFWDAERGRLISTVPRRDGYVEHLVFSPDGQRIVASGGSGIARICDLEGREIAVLEGHQKEIVHVSFSADGARLVTASFDKTARIWDAESGEEMAVLEGHTDSVACAVFDPAGHRVLTASVDGTARIWDTASGREIRLLKDQGFFLTDAELSPDGRYVLTTGWGGVPILWDAGTGEKIVSLSGHEDLVNCMAFSRDGRKIVTGSDDTTARVWDSRSGRPLAVLEGHLEKVVKVGFSPDGRRVLTAGRDGTVRIYFIEFADLLSCAESRIPAMDPDAAHAVEVGSGTGES